MCISKKNVKFNGYQQNRCELERKEGKKKVELLENEKSHFAWLDFGLLLLEKLTVQLHEN